MTLEPITCKYCDVEFVPRDSRQMICGRDKCKRTHKRNWEKCRASQKKRPKTCPYCGVKFTPMNSRKITCYAESCTKKLDAVRWSRANKRRRGTLKYKQACRRYSKKRRTTSKYKQWRKIYRATPEAKASYDLSRKKQAIILRKRKLLANMTKLGEVFKSHEEVNKQ